MKEYQKYRSKPRATFIEHTGTVTVSGIAAHDLHVILTLAKLGLCEREKRPHKCDECDQDTKKLHFIVDSIQNSVSEQRFPKVDRRTFKERLVDNKKERDIINSILEDICCKDTSSGMPSDVKVVLANSDEQPSNC